VLNVSSFAGSEAIRPQASAPGKAADRFYLRELDGIRFLAFGLVWLHHYPPAPLRLLKDIKMSGWIGVDVFLVLSSFLITSLLLVEFDTKGGISLSRFYSRRFLRIWPLLGLALFLNYVVLPASHYVPAEFQARAMWHDIRFHGIPNLLLLGNWSVAAFGYLRYGYIDQLWTINLEEQFYLLWPILLLFLAPYPSRLLFSCAGLILISYVARIYYIEVRFPHPALWVSTITRLDPLALGGILAVLYRRRKSVPLTRAKQWRNTAGAALVFCVVLAAVCLLLRSWDWTHDRAIWWKLGLVDVGITILIACFLASSILSAMLRLAPIAWLGKISYGLYVYHKFFAQSRFAMEIRMLMHDVVDSRAVFIFWLLGMALNGTLLIGVSALSYYGYERWFLKLKERFEVILSRPA
jgi:peptidoglycan/LPS O-acetylase OafA/YrhL